MCRVAVVIPAGHRRTATSKFRKKRLHLVMRRSQPIRRTHVTPGSTGPAYHPPDRVPLPTAHGKLLKPPPFLTDTILI
jgi:hypothetical protein